MKTQLEYDLQESILFNNIESVNLLIKAGADIHADDGMAIVFAAANGHSTIVQLLIDSGANIHVRDELALELAAKNKHYATTGLLIENGAVAKQSIWKLLKVN